uniref:Uncharacterized protein n=1 Tax=Heterorhabditis bacteriophora TaxID=37862 RepID=A0A1I7WAY6_HETBA
MEMENRKKEKRKHVIIILLIKIFFNPISRIF